MYKRGLFSTILTTLLIIILATVLVVTYFITANYAIVDWKLFPKSETLLDLRQQSLTPEQFLELSVKLPNTTILWGVPFQGKRIDSSVEALTVHQLTKDDVDLMTYFPKLKRVDASDCTDYAALSFAYQRFPNVDFQYQVSISGTEYDVSAETVTLTMMTAQDAILMEYLPNLKTINAIGCRDRAAVAQVQSVHPQWTIHITDTIAGKKISPNATTLEVTGANYEELSVGLAAMQNLKTLTIHNPKADTKSLLALREEYPDITIHWDVEFRGKRYSDELTEVDLSDQKINNIQQVKDFAAKLPNLTKLILDTEGIADEDMAIYRDEVRDQYKVVWIVYFTAKCQARTDDIYFMPIKQGEYYFQESDVGPLKYCEDMVCIDIGHSTVKTIDFAAYMPHLRYLILAWTQVTDLTPLSNCKELVYLEIDHGVVHDFTPLLGCTALEDLNINDQQWGASIEPLTKMTWLKTLWMPKRSYADQQMMIEALPDTRVVTQDVGSNTGLGWRNLQNYYDMRDCLGMYYMN